MIANEVKIIMTDESKLEVLVRTEAFQKDKVVLTKQDMKEFEIWRQTWYPGMEHKCQQELEEILIRAKDRLKEDMDEECCIDHHGHRGGGPLDY